MTLKMAHRVLLEGICYLIILEGRRSNKRPHPRKHKPVYRDISEGRMRELKTRGVSLMAHDHDSLFLCHLGNALSGYSPGLLRPLGGKT